MSLRWRKPCIYQGLQAYLNISMWPASNIPHLRRGPACGPPIGSHGVAQDPREATLRSRHARLTVHSGDAGGRGFETDRVDAALPLDIAGVDADRQTCKPYQSVQRTFTEQLLAGNFDIQLISRKAAASHR